MKKAVISLFLLLLLLPIVNAQQTITLFGTEYSEYSIIVIAPLFFIMLSMFFIAMYIKDNIGKAMYIKDNIGKWTRFKLPKFKFDIFKKKKHKKKAGKKKEVSINHLERFNLFKKQLRKLSANEAFQQYSRITKDFLKDSLGIAHEFTYAELKHIVKGHKRAVKLAEDISTIKYSDKEITADIVKNLVKRLEPLIESYAPEKEEVKPGLFGKIKANLFKPRKIGKIEREEREITEIVPPKGITNIQYYFMRIKRFFRLRTVKVKKVHVLNLIRRGESNLDKNAELARKFYSEALLDYYRLPIKQEKELEDRITNFHEELLKRKKHRKEFLDLPKKLLKLKHDGKQVSKEGLGLIKKFIAAIEKEEKGAVGKIKELEETLVKKERGFLRKLRAERKRKAVEKNEDYILNLIKRGKRKLSSNIKESIRLYRRALLGYYKLPVIKEKDVATELFNLHNEILVQKEHRKHIHRLDNINKVLKKEESKLKKKFERFQQRRLQKGLLKKVLSEKEQHFQEIFKKPTEVVVSPELEKVPLPPLSREEVGIKPTYRPKVKRKMLTKTLKTLRDEKDSIYEKLSNLEKEELTRFKKQYYTKEIKKEPYVSKYQDLIEETKPRSSEEEIGIRKKGIIETS